LGEKCRIVEQTLKPGASVARVALAHGVNANQVFSWRRRYRQGLLSQRDAEPVDSLAIGQNAYVCPSRNCQWFAVLSTASMIFPSPLARHKVNMACPSV
jgi:transposase-like protein